MLAVLSMLVDETSLRAIPSNSLSPSSDPPSEGLSGQRLVAELLCRRCSELLRTFPTTLLEDEAMLLDPATMVPATALQYRIGKKQVLSGFMGMLSR